MSQLRCFSSSKKVTSVNEPQFTDNLDPNNQPLHSPNMYTNNLQSMNTFIDYGLFSVVSRRLNFKIKTWRRQK